MSKRTGRSFVDDDEGLKPPSIPRDSGRETPLITNSGAASRARRYEAHETAASQSGTADHVENNRARYGVPQARTYRPESSGPQPGGGLARDGHGEESPLPSTTARTRGGPLGSGDDEIRTAKRRAVSPAAATATPGALTTGGSPRTYSPKSADEGIPSPDATSRRGGPPRSSDEEMHAAKRRAVSPAAAATPGAMAMRGPTRTKSADEGIPPMPVPRSPGSGVASMPRTGREQGKQYHSRMHADEENKPVAGPGAYRHVPGKGSQPVPVQHYDELTSASEEARAPPVPVSSPDLAVAAELVPGEKDIEAQVQARVHDEREEIAAQVEKRLMDQAAHATVMSTHEEDVEEDQYHKRSIAKRRWLFLGSLFLVIIAVVIVLVVVVVGKNNKDDDSSTDKPLQPNATLAPAETPTLAPTFAPISEDNCTFCVDGTIPTGLDTIEYPLGGDDFTCADFMAEQVKLNPSDPTCVQGQAQAWRVCGCPTVPTFPENATCTFCEDRSVPWDRPNQDGLSGTCEDVHAFIGHVGSNDQLQCDALSETFLPFCGCGDPSSFGEYLINILVPISSSALFDESTPQFQALNWLTNEDPARLSQNTATDEELTQRYIIALLYFSTSGSTWSDKYNFLSELNVCTWNDVNDGIFCDSSSRVIKIELDSNNLRGIIPNETASLSTLEMIELGSNSLTGRIPEHLGNLTSLTRFDIGKNSIGGIIPPGLFNIRTMKEFWIRENLITGPLPEITGSLSTVESINAFDCGLTGTLPESLSRARSLVFLELGQNNFTGRFPTFSDAPKLSSLGLFENQLTGTLPDSVARLSKLEWLNARNNFLTGEIPQDIGSSRFLATIDLSDNELTGTLPAFIGGKIYQVWAKGNRLTGSLDNFFDTASTSTLIHVRLEENELSGTLPSSISTFTRLRQINLGRNLMSGTIPSELGNLRDAQYMQFYDTGFNGRIPTELGLQTGLLTLDFGENDLEGTVSFEFTNLSNLEQLGLHQCGLTGVFPESIATLPNLEFLAIAGNDFSNDYDQTFCSRTTPIEFLMASCLEDSIVCPCCTHCCTDEGFSCVEQ